MDASARKKTRTYRYGRRPLAAGIDVSNDTRETLLNNNDIVIGNSGCGKTGGYVVPNIQQIDGSLVVSDTKGQLERRFKRELREKGYQVYTLDLVDPLRSCGYNPLSYVRRYEDGSIREQDVLTIAKILCPITDHHEPIWDMCAASYVAFLIGYCLEALDPQEHSLETICKLRRQFSQKNGDIPFINWIEDHKESFTSKKYYEIMANRNAEKMWASVEGFVTSNLEPFTFREAEQLFSNKKEFDIGELGRKKTVVFLNVSDTDRSLDKLVTTFFTQTLMVLCSQADQNPDGKLKVPVRIIMDDFAAGARIPDFDKTISVIRSRDIYVSLILQSLSQLDTMYMHASSLTIINNCDHIIFMGSQDRETAEFISYRACKTPEVILSMPRDKLYLICTGEKAKLVDKIAPYSTTSVYVSMRPKDDEDKGIQA